MGSLLLAASTPSNVSMSTFYNLCINPKKQRNFQKQHVNFLVFAAKDDDKLGNWDQMERKFGKLLGEKPKLTLAKIKDRNSNIRKEPVVKAPITTTHGMPNVILRNIITFKEDDVGANMSSSLSLKPNLSLKMGKEDVKKQFSDMILVKRDNVEYTIDTKESTCHAEEHISVFQKSESIVDQAYGDHNRSINLELTSRLGNLTSINLDPTQESGDVSSSQDGGHMNDLVTGPQPSEHRDIESAEKNSASNITRDSVIKLSLDATLQGPPKRLEQAMKDRPYVGGRITTIQNLILNAVRSESLAPTPPFKVSFGSLIGFLPYRNLANKMKFLAFESWLRGKGLDPATYRRKLDIIGSYHAKSKTTSPNPNVDSEMVEGKVLPHMELENLLAIYDQDKIEFLSTFVGQKIKVNVILANRDSRKLIFSVKPKEQEELIQRKINLMTKLHVGDTVTCHIKKISYFGIFVEVEGVPALIHQSEVSWDATLNPTSSFKIGQVVNAKVHQMDFSLERIFLSLKEITPDPLTDSLETVLGHHAVLNGTLEANQAETEWSDLESLVKELQQYDGIESVTKGQFFLSPGLTSTFQVYVASMFKNQYNLLARAGNKVQEVVLQTSLNTEEIKHAILSCTKLAE